MKSRGVSPPTPGTQRPTREDGPTIQSGLIGGVWQLVEYPQRCAYARVEVQVTVAMVEHRVVYNFITWLSPTNITSPSNMWRSCCCEDCLSVCITCLPYARFQVSQPACICTVHPCPVSLMHMRSASREDYCTVHQYIGLLGQRGLISRRQATRPPL
jgi:hypothetical protein